MSPDRTTVTRKDVYEVHLFHGGCWDDGDPQELHAHRHHYDPADYRENGLGFRTSLSVRTTPLDLPPTTEVTNEV